jgi:uncharacterized coiled-coil DUF342 family protein
MRAFFIVKKQDKYMATLAELKAELAEIKSALSAIRTAGQSYTLNAGTGGTSRTVTMADYATLRKEKDEIEAKISGLSNTRATVIRAGW